MIDDLKPYPEYKESGLPWASEIPAHWKTYRAKALLDRVDERSKTGKEELLTVSSARGVVPRKSAKVTMFKAESYLGYKLCWPGDLVINSLWAWGGGLGVSKHHGIISSAYGVYRTRPTSGMNPEFLHELVRSTAFNWELMVRSKGVWISRLQLTDESFLNAPIYVPPPDEQAAIVRFLGHLNRRVDQAIRSKRKLIALLNEQKQAIIHKAVTRGLDPNAPLKDSGIPWLGQIPAHWGARRLKHGITPIEQGWSPQCDAQPAEDGEWGVLKVGCVNKEAFSPEQNKKLPHAFKPVETLEIKDGDILVSRANTKELLGLAALVETPRPKLIMSDKLFRFKVRQNLFNQKFLVAALRSKPSREQIETSTNGASSSMQNIGQGVLKNLQMPLPPVIEQTQIIDFIDKESSPLRDAVTRFEREIDLLREYRTRLVSDVVTGKLDVRAAAAQLPPEDDTSDSIVESEEVDELDDEVVEEAA